MLLAARAHKAFVTAPLSAGTRLDLGARMLEYPYHGAPHRPAQAPPGFPRPSQFKRTDHPAQRCCFQIPLPEALQQDMHQEQRQHEVDDRRRVVSLKQ